MNEGNNSNRNDNIYNLLTPKGVDKYVFKCADLYRGISTGFACINKRTGISIHEFNSFPKSIYHLICS